MRSANWVLPPWLAHDDVVPMGTRIGVIDGPVSSLVDGRGLVTPVDDGLRPSLDWWVGADDRWYLPAREAGVTQRRLDGAPVVETTMRVPGGTVVHRAFGARGPAYPGGDDWIVAEVENRSALPVVLAWALRPYSPSGATESRHATFSPSAADDPQGAQVLEGDDPFGVLRRPPSRWVWEGGGTDPVHAVLAGDARAGPLPEELQTGVHDPTLVSAAFLVPLPHTATGRVALFGSPFDVEARRPSDSLSAADVAWPAHLPDAASVVRGWTVLADRGPRIELPDPVLAEAVAAARRSLALGHRVRREPASSVVEAAPLRHVVTTGDGVGRPDPVGDRMELLAALSWWGDHDDVDRALVSWANDQQRGGGFGDPVDTALALRALAAQAVASGDVGPAQAWLPELSGAVESLGRAARRLGPTVDGRLVAEGLDAAAVLLAGLEQPAAAARIAAHAREVAAAAGPSGSNGVDLDAPATTPRTLAAAAVVAARTDHDASALWALLRRASATWTWSDPERWVGDDGLVGARLLDAVARLLVADRPGGLALVPRMPPAWWGLGWEVHAAPTRWGHLSYAVRWHSGRPAVLWELGDPLGGIGSDVVLTAPGLDPAWRSTDRVGEALLMPVVPPDGHPSVAVDGDDGPGGPPVAPTPGVRGVAVAAPPRSVWRPSDPGPDAPPRPHDPAPDGGHDDPPSFS